MVQRTDQNRNKDCSEQLNSRRTASKKLTGKTKQISLIDTNLIQPLKPQLVVNHGVL